MKKETVKNNNDNKNQKKKKAKVRIFQKKSKGLSEKEKINKLQEQYSSIDIANVKTFLDLPLSANTLQGLKECFYKTPTEIQRETIGLSLQGKDVLGAAKTGSGKTLAFLIPILEILYCKQWTNLDGVGALVITPTRELAYQIFEALRKVGAHHEFSAGLVIGGKDLKFETKRMDQCNIVIGTPGRLLQHMDENPLFDCTNMQILVLDEADRCLDMGFQQAMNAIIANLPQKRQTLLFSATQTKSVKDLARLSLKDSCYVSVHENAKHSTPENLEQSYIVCELPEKMSVLWSFIRNHLKQKIIVFFSSCKEVKYVYEIFCRLRPGLSLLALYGTLHQLRRMAIYDEFCRKSNAVLFATDLAARGLDFPQVHWVVQADCPEDVETYIHRVGRTARFHRGGESLLLLLPSEEKAMLKELDQKKIPINNLEINPKRQQNPVRKMEAFLARDPALKATAQRAFVAYIKAVYLMKNKKIFDVESLDTDAFAHSLGLAISPRIRFLERRTKQLKEKSKPKQNMSNESEPQNNKIVFKDSDQESDEDESSSENIHDNYNNNNNSYKKSAFDVSDDSDNDEGILTVKRKNHDIDDPLSESEIIDFSQSNKNKKALSRAAVAKKILKKKIVPNKKIVFDEEGEAVPTTKEKRSAIAQQYENANIGGIDIETAKQVLREEDKFDKQRFREKVKAKHREEKRKLKEQKRREQEKDEFGSDSEEYQPDLSWLPDPDKIYGKQDENTDEINYEELNEDIVVETPEKLKKIKRKLKPKKTEKPAKKHKLNIEDVSASLSVNEAEELALMLLQNKK